MYCLLRRSTLSVHRNARHRLRQAGCECRRAGDISGLRTDVVQAAEDHIVDCFGIQVVSTDHGANDVGGHVCRVLVAQSATALADRCANRINNISLSHPNNLT
jgi:hypothetical protein